MHNDPGIRQSVPLEQGQNIVFREASVLLNKVNSYRPFDQAKSDEDESEEIRIVTCGDEIHVMNGNHRIYGAILDNCPRIVARVYTPEQWELYTKMPFNRHLGFWEPDLK